MTDLEDAVRVALRTLPEPDMRLPIDFPDDLRRRYDRRRRYAPVATAGVVAATVGVAAVVQSHAGAPAPRPPAVSPTPTVTPTPATSPPPVIPDQRLSRAAVPGWAGSDGTTAWSGTPQAFTVAGSPVFVVGESVPGPLLVNDPTMSKKPEAEVKFQRTAAQVDMPPNVGMPLQPPSIGSKTAPSVGSQQQSQANAVKSALAQENAAAAAGTSASPTVGSGASANPSYGCETGSAGTEGAFGLTTPALMQLRCWPTLQENIWVWSRLPAGVTTLAYVLDGQVVARSTTLDSVGAIRLPRPASATADQGQLEGLSSTGAVLLRASLPWID